MNAAPRMMFATEVPFLRLLPPPTPAPESFPSHRPASTPAALEENRRRAALSHLLDSMAAQVSPRHWGINE